MCNEPSLKKYFNSIDLSLILNVTLTHVDGDLALKAVENV